MGKLRIVRAEEVPWMTGGDDSDQETDDDGLLEASEETMSAARFLHPGNDNELQVFEVRLRPDAEAAPHAHVNDEVILVTEGSITLGARAITPGWSVYIPAETLYGFKAGSEGARFLNFRATKDLSFITKEKFVGSRTLRTHDNSSS